MRGRGLTRKANWIKALLICTLLSPPPFFYKAEATPCSSQQNISTLSPNSTLKPLVDITEDPLNKYGYQINENLQDREKLENSSKEEIAFIYLSYLIGEILYKYPKKINATILKELIRKDLGHIDFQKFIWEEIYQINGYFYLPYIEKDGELGILRYSISEAKDANTENPYSFFTEDGKAWIECKKIYIETRKSSIKRTLKYVDSMNDEKIEKELHKRVKGKNVLFLSFRLDATDLDGVSQETEKWSDVMNECGANIFYYSGQTKPPKYAKGRTFKLAHFLIKEIERVMRETFRMKRFSWKRFDIPEQIAKDKERIKKDLTAYIIKNNIDYLVYENVLSYPGNIALSLAAMEVANERCLPVIAHNHDFYWERKRFRDIRGELKDFFNGIITKIRKLSTIVICSRQVSDMEKIGRADTILIPNVMNYEKPPKISDKKRSETKEKVRDLYGMNEDEIFLLAPVRPVARKFLKRAVKAAEEIAEKYDTTVNLMVSHPAGDELDGEYWECVKTFAEEYKNVRIIDASEDIKNKIISLEDTYLASDFVIYSSNWEGWGNVVAEAVYYKKPMIIYPYRVYREDIKPTGVDFIEMLRLPYKGDFEMDIVEEDYLEEPALSDESLKRIGDIRQDPQEIVDKNYEIFRKHFSYKVLKRGLLGALENIRQINNRIRHEIILTKVDLIRKKHQHIKNDDPEELEHEYWFRRFKEILGKDWKTPVEISQEISGAMNENYNGALMVEYLQKFAFMGVLTKRFNQKGQPIYKMKNPKQKESIYDILLYGLNNRDKRSAVWMEADAQEGRKAGYEKELVKQFFGAFIKAQRMLKEDGVLNKKIAIAIQTEWIPKIIEDSVMKHLLADKSFENICIVSDRDTSTLAQKIVNENVLPENVIVIGPKRIANAKELKFLKENAVKEAFFAEIKLPEDFPKDESNIYYPLIEIMNISMRYAFGDEWQTLYPNIKSIEKISERIIKITPFAEKVDLDLLQKRYNIQAKQIDIMA